MNNINSEIIFLDWDSSFFGFNVASWNGAPTNEADFDNGIARLRLLNIQVCYLFVKEQEEAALEFLHRRGHHAVDVKTTYLNENPAALAREVAEVQSYHGPATEGLLALGLQAGVYSRFHVDPLFPDSKFEELYNIWTERSAQHEIAFDLILTGAPEQPTGMVTLGEKNGRGDIGLVAVSAGHRGQGIASKLMHHAMFRFVETGYDKVQVVTQGQNVEASRLYEKFGFSIESQVHIFHIHL